MQNINIKLNLSGTKRLIEGHPWVKRTDLVRFRHPPAPGTLVRFQDAAGNFLGHGFSDEGEAIYRVLTKERHPDFEGEFFSLRVEEALRRRHGIMEERMEGAFRLLNAEADGLPGVRADCFAGWCVVDCDSAGSAAFSRKVEKALGSHFRPKGILRRVRFRGGRGGVRREVALEAVAGQKAPGKVMVRLQGLQTEVDLLRGMDLRHRETFGLAVDQASGQRVWINAVPMAAHYALLCLRAGAKSVGLAEADKGKIQEFRQFAKLNGVDPKRIEWVEEAAIDALSFLKGKRIQAGFLVQGLPPRQKGRGGVFDASRHSPRLIASAMQRVEAGGSVLVIAHDSTVGEESLLSLLAQGESLAEAQATLHSMTRPGVDFPRLDLFAKGTPFLAALMRVHQPGHAELTKMKTRVPIKRRNKAAKGKGKKAGKTRRKRASHA